MIDLCRLKFEIQPASLNKLQSPIKQKNNGWKWFTCLKRNGRVLKCDKALWNDLQDCFGVGTF